MLDSKQGCSPHRSARGEASWQWLCSYSAVIEHTNRVIFLEDDDVAAVVDGRLSIHRIKRTAGDHPGRAVQTLQMELQQIMKGKVLWMIPVQCTGPPWGRSVSQAEKTAGGHLGQSLWSKRGQEIRGSMVLVSRRLEALQGQKPLSPCTGALLSL